MHRTQRPTSVLALTVLIALGAASGCAPVRAGAAAVVGDSRISTDDVRIGADQLVAQSPQVQRDKAVGVTVGYLVQYAVIEELARRQRPPVTVSAAEVAGLRNSLVTRAGGADQLRQAFLQQQVPTQGEEAFLRSLLLRDKIGAALVAGDSTDQAVGEQRAAAVQKAAQQTAADLHIRVNPRFGRWDTATFLVTPLASGGLATAATPAPAPSEDPAPAEQAPAG